MEAPQKLQRRAQRRSKRTRICIGVVAIIIVILPNAITCALLLSESTRLMNPVTILLPLYTYPTKNAWEPLFNAIDQNPSTNITVIVNVDSGPGGEASPGSPYVSAVRRLNAAQNVNTIGYVRTNYSSRDIDLVIRDVATYSRWSDLDGTLAVSGIFFDETPHDLQQLQEPSYLADTNRAVENSAGIRDPKLVIHNPDTIPSARLSPPGTDVTVIFENSFDAFQNSEAALEALPGSRSSYSIMVHSVPSGKNLGKLLRTMSQGAEYLFLTSADEGFYEHFSGSWDRFVSIMGS